MKVQLNPDHIHVAEIRAALKDNDGHCPCRLEKTPDTKCPCKEFREQTEPGLCHCELFQKVEETLYD